MSIENKPKVSVIIPVYNVECYLRECLESIVNQTLRDIEIICVNDGSTDNSLAILNEYKAKDSRFTVISQDNQGVSSARNRGIDAATGEYLMFVDSDDWIAEDSCEILYNTANQRNSDILLFSYYLFSQISNSPDGRLNFLACKFGENNVNFAQEYESLIYVPMTVCGKFYKRSLLEDNNIRFKNNIVCGEDHVFFMHACIYAKAVSVFDKALYYYRLDVTNSLSKTSKIAFPHMYKSYIAIKHLLKKADLEEYDKIYVTFLNRTLQRFNWQWNSMHMRFAKSKYVNYMYKLDKLCKKIKKEDKPSLTHYADLQTNIFKYRFLFVSKLFQPLIEFEQRRNRFVVYLFEKQFINISIYGLLHFLHDLKYIRKLLFLRIFARNRKIKVGFWVTDVQKWTCQSVYEKLKNNKHFEPIVFLACFKKPEGGLSPQQLIENNTEYFKKLNVNYCPIYDVANLRHLPISDFKVDILFYQQPWSIPWMQGLDISSNFALTCYIPYCFYSMKSYYNYLKGFHGKLWKYFVETDYHRNEYKNSFNAHNCVAVGSVKYDNYITIAQRQTETNPQQKSTRKCVIYAPHHSFDKYIDHRVATFDKNGDFILELAKKHPEIDWVFRPHPIFKDQVLKYQIKTLKEIDNYYDEWCKIGRLSDRNSNYYEEFVNSDCLITDCISFLAEYLPSEHPVIHLRNEKQLYPYNDLLKKITDDYYQVFDNETLENIFERVVVNGDDYLKDKRIDNVKLVLPDNTKSSVERIVDYLEKELWIKR